MQASTSKALLEYAEHAGFGRVACTVSDSGVDGGLARPDTAELPAHLPLSKDHPVGPVHVVVRGMDPRTPLWTPINAGR